MRQLSTITDPGYRSQRVIPGLDRQILLMIKDPRDLTFVYLCMKITALIIPMAILLFSSVQQGWQWWLGAAVYAGLIIYFVGPYTLMLHNTSHRVLFKHEYKWANYYIPWVLGPFMGQSPETYFSHHIGMHHAENNLHADKSSTMPFRRDSFVDFLKYFSNFFVAGIYELAVYFKKKEFTKFFNKVIRGESFFIILCVLTSFIHLKAAIWIFVVPMVIVRFSMMAGNWAQHAFIDADAPANSYRNSITCINNAYNRKCFNDGYHIGHHLRPHMHWTDMPGDFLKNKSKYILEKAIVYEGLDFHMVWALLMCKRYDVLASHVVDMGDQYQSKEQVIELLKERTKPIYA